ncbi:MAG: FHA domain-containing protein [Phycisphaeraceae bacterium]|nr:FHA domain-containing protein [Phycisphaeraceae bacterium]
MDVSLVMIKADGSRRDFPLTTPRTVIGRQNTADLRVPLSAISRNHCEVRVKDGKVLVRDLGSSNGTYRNGKRVKEAYLKPGDRIQVGPVIFTVIINGRPGAVDPSSTLIAQAQRMDDVTTLESQGKQAPPSVPVETEPQPLSDSEYVEESKDEDDDLAALSGLELSEEELEDDSASDDLMPAEVESELEVEPGDRVAGSRDATLMAEPVMDDDEPLEAEGGDEMEDRLADLERRAQLFEAADEADENADLAADDEDPMAALHALVGDNTNDDSGETAPLPMMDVEDDDPLAALSGNESVPDEADPISALEALADAGEDDGDLPALADDDDDEAPPKRR